MVDNKDLGNGVSGNDTAKAIISKTGMKNRIGAGDPTINDSRKTDGSTASQNMGYQKG